MFDRVLNTPAILKFITLSCTSCYAGVVMLHVLWKLIEIWAATMLCNKFSLIEHLLQPKLNRFLMKGFINLNNLLTLCMSTG